MDHNNTDEILFWLLLQRPHQSIWCISLSLSYRKQYIARGNKQISKKRTLNENGIAVSSQRITLWLREYTETTGMLRENWQKKWASTSGSNMDFRGLVYAYLRYEKFAARYLTHLRLCGVFNLFFFLIKVSLSISLRCLWFALHFKNFDLIST